MAISPTVCLFRLPNIYTPFLPWRTHVPFSKETRAKWHQALPEGRRPRSLGDGLLVKSHLILCDLATGRLQDLPQDESKKWDTDQMQLNLQFGKRKQEKRTAVTSPSLLISSTFLWFRASVLILTRWVRMVLPLGGYSPFHCFSLSSIFHGEKGRGLRKTLPYGSCATPPVVWKPGLWG